MRNMANKDQPDYALPIEFLRLGEVLCANGTFRRSPTRDAGRRQTNADEVEAMVDALLEKVTKSPQACLRLGLRRGVSRDRARIRLKVVAVLGWQGLRLSSESIEIGDLAAVAADPRLPPMESLLRARHEVGVMSAEDVLIGISDEQNGPIRKVHLPFKSLEYLAGGKTSMGFLTAGKLVGVLAQDAHPDDGRPSEPPKIPTPRQLFQKIRERVIGLDSQASTIASRLVMHMTRAAMLRAGDDPGTPNECLLVIGSPGVGKTTICQVACEAASELSGGAMPFAVADGSDLSAEGYVGLSMTDTLKHLLLAAKGDVELARYGFLAIDEFSKKARSMGESPVNTVAVQQEALRIISGQYMLVGGRRGWDRPIGMSTIGTGFALMGHCPGLNRMIEKRMGRRQLGFAIGDENKRSRDLLIGGLLDFGLIEELVSRLTTILVIQPPDLDSLARALTAEHGILASYNRLLSAHGSKLFLDPSAIEALARHGLEGGYFRAMKRVVSALACEAIFEERRGTAMIEAVDIRMAVARADGDAAELLTRTRPAAEEYQEECNADDGHGCTTAGG